MPIERKAWACQWKCGARVQTARKRMEAHEARCFHNPSRRACQTCVHHAMDSETVYNPYHGGNPGSTDYEVQIPYCEADETIDLKTGPRCDCPLWSTAAGQGREAYPAPAGYAMTARDTFHRIHAAYREQFSRFTGEETWYVAPDVWTRLIAELDPLVIDAEARGSYYCGLPVVVNHMLEPGTVLLDGHPLSEKDGKR